jgi:hypothetical protein
MAEVGRPSQLDDEQFLLKIRELYLDGKNEKQIAEILEVPIGTWDYWKWKNYQGFSDKLLSYKHERIIRKAEANLEQLLDGEDEKIRADLSKFALETLSKKQYSKRSDITSDDKPIIFPTAINIIKPE